ncbi:hypothetical protein CE91St30_17380 [Raoultibacter timonensis]|uniref:Uncharacterized protein n=1 Tax=Raoultibacter timonensis TaxID=1907662 RepID=A0ABN6MEJ7_9ACTN|nr:hypothetical protein CE91St30_17380 [Raoultibacter timonensis]BDF51009.1 hypothetical protein CE91St31_17390 [Raoultibacter timonensis]
MPFFHSDFGVLNADPGSFLPAASATGWFPWMACRENQPAKPTAATSSRAVKAVVIERAEERCVCWG